MNWPYDLGEPPRPKWIVNKARARMEIPGGPHIYFAWESEIVYVGLTENLRNRISSHDRIKNGFGLSWIPCPLEDLYYMESHYIWRCRPKMNFGLRRKGKDGKPAGTRASTWITDVEPINKTVHVYYVRTYLFPPRTRRWGVVDENEKLVSLKLHKTAIEAIEEKERLEAA